MGRPEKHPDEKRTERHNLRFTIAEMNHVRAQADAAGLDVAEYIRRRAVGYVAPAGTGRRGADPRLIGELNALGNNVNQLARAVHRGSRFTDQWEALAQRVGEILERLLLDEGDD